MRVCVCMYMYIGVDILRFMHEYVFVCGDMFLFMLVIVFAVTICAHTISFDGNLVCFCPVYSGIRLINPRLINPAAYHIQFAWNGIVPILSRYKNFG